MVNDEENGKYNSETHIGTYYRRSDTGLLLVIYVVSYDDA